MQRKVSEKGIRESGGGCQWEDRDRDEIEVRGARCEVRGARCGARCQVRETIKPIPDQTVRVDQIRASNEK
jgi:hypothetical protein